MQKFSVYTQAQINGYHEDKAKYDPTNISSNDSPTSRTSSKNDIVARQNSSVQNFSLYTQAQINGYREDEARYDPTNISINETSPTSGNWAWDLGDQCNSTSKQNYSTFTQVQMHGYHEDIQKYQNTDSARNDYSSSYSRRQQNSYPRRPENPYSSRYQHQNRYSSSRPQNPYSSRHQPQNPYSSPKPRNPYLSRPQNPYSSRLQTRGGESRSNDRQQLERIPSQREANIIEMRCRLRIEHEQRMLTYPFRSDEDEYNLYESSIENERESNLRVPRALVQHTEDRRKRRHERRRRQSDQRTYY